MDIENVIAIDLLRLNPHWWSPVPVISSAYVISLERRMLDKILFEYDKKVVKLMTENLYAKIKNNPTEQCQGAIRCNLNQNK
jgi:hypothetical protein